MGRVFLVAIVGAAVWGGWKVWENIQRVTHPHAPPVAAASEIPEGQDTGALKKTSLAPSSAQVSEVHHEKAPLPVLSSCSEWILVESWAVVRVGESLPDGSVLESWDASAATVCTLEGRRERRRFRRIGEALAAVVPTNSVASAAQPVGFSPWAPGGLEKK